MAALGLTVAAVAAVWGALGASMPRTYIFPRHILGSVSTQMVAVGPQGLQWGRFGRPTNAADLRVSTTLLCYVSSHMAAVRATRAEVAAVWGAQGASMLRIYDVSRHFHVRFSPYG